MTGGKCSLFEKFAKMRKNRAHFAYIHALRVPLHPEDRQSDVLDCLTDPVHSPRRDAQSLPGMAHGLMMEAVDGAPSSEKGTERATRHKLDPVQAVFMPVFAEACADILDKRPAEGDIY